MDGFEGRRVAFMVCLEGWMGALMVFDEGGWWWSIMRGGTEGWRQTFRERWRGSLVLKGRRGAIPQMRGWRRSVEPGVWREGGRWGSRVGEVAVV